MIFFSFTSSVSRGIRPWLTNRWMFTHLFCSSLISRNVVNTPAMGFRRFNACGCFVSAFVNPSIFFFYYFYQVHDDTINFFTLVFCYIISQYFDILYFIGISTQFIETFRSDFVSSVVFRNKCTKFCQNNLNGFDWGLISFEYRSENVQNANYQHYFNVYAPRILFRGVLIKSYFFYYFFVKKVFAQVRVGAKVTRFSEIDKYF